MAYRVHTLHALKDNFIYILDFGAQCAVVDPGVAAPVDAYLKQSGLILSHILLTHHHRDHTAGVAELKNTYGSEVWCSRIDVGRIEGATKALDEGDYTLCGETVSVLDIPGHTLGQIGFYFKEYGHLFVGDTLFSAGCGRLFEGSFTQMFDSLQRIKSLPEDTEIYFGHEYTLKNLEFVEQNAGAPPAELGKYRQLVTERLIRGIPSTPTNLKTENVINPFLSAKSAEEFKHWRELKDRS